MLAHLGIALCWALPEGPRKNEAQRVELKLVRVDVLKKKELVLVATNMYTNLAQHQSGNKSKSTLRDQIPRMHYSEKQGKSSAIHIKDELPSI